jgi:hypothetical protein
MVAKAPARKRNDATSQECDDTLPKTNSPGPGSPDRFGGKPRGRARANLRETTKLLKAMRRAGGSFRLEFTPDGRPVIVDQAPASTSIAPNSWDEIYAADKERSA